MGFLRSRTRPSGRPAWGVKGFRLSTIYHPTSITTNWPSSIFQSLVTIVYTAPWSSGELYPCYGYDCFLIQLPCRPFYRVPCSGSHLCRWLVSFANDPTFPLCACGLAYDSSLVADSYRLLATPSFISAPVFSVSVHHLRPFELVSDRLCLRFLDGCAWAVSQILCPFKNWISPSLLTCIVRRRHHLSSLRTVLAYDISHVADLFPLLAALSFLPASVFFVSSYYTSSSSAKV